jgi:uncharacterized protein
MVETQRPIGTPRGEVILVHGLESCSQAGYLLTMAQVALEAGYVTHRFNMRDLYNGGLTDDLRWLLEHLREQGRAPVHMVGYSLGGNVILKLAGELGEAARPLVASLSAVSTAIDLEACCRKLCTPGNAIYHKRFLRKLIARTQLQNPTITGLDKVRTLVEFDDLVTGPFFGFRDAMDYYRWQSSARFLGGIRVPTLILQAKDDPIIPFSTFLGDPAIKENPYLHLLATEHGGHVGFLTRGPRRFWCDVAVLDWVVRHSSPQCA